MKKKTAGMMACALVLLAGLAAGCASAKPGTAADGGGKKTDSSMQIKTAHGTQKAFLTADDWGPAVTKTVITFSREIDGDSLSPEKFAVIEEKSAFHYDTMKKDTVSSQRTVLDAYPSDAQGSRVEGNSSTIAIELQAGPLEGSAFVYNAKTQFNEWCDPYRLQVSLASGAELSSEGNPVTELDIAPDIPLAKEAGEGRICPQEDGLSSGTYTMEDGTVYSYAEYIPPQDETKNALVIWLHGLGEGGTDPSVAYFGNKVTALAGSEFQELFGGAYVLIPQCPTMWMDDGNGSLSWGGQESIYTESLFEMIDGYVQRNEDIDTNRIIIGGCSNGGFMTVNLILRHPDYFAAAYPVCAAYGSEFITDAQIQDIKNLPVWFTYARNDTVVDPAISSVPIIQRLRDGGAGNIHVSEFADVHDTSGRYKDGNGESYPYQGHWSWIYVFNRECVDENGTDLWEWLSQQKKG